MMYSHPPFFDGPIPFQHMLKPPETLSVWPVMNAAASEARKATGPAMSSGLPRRRKGTALVMASIILARSRPS